jgi:hypothetical protein
VFSTIGLILVAGTDEIGDRQETRATEPMLKAARYSRLPAGSPITKNDHMCRNGRGLTCGFCRVALVGRRRDSVSTRLFKANVAAGRCSLSAIAERKGDSP